MNGILVVNHFLTDDKYKELYKHLKKTAEKMNINLKINTNLELSVKRTDADFALFWDKDICLARRLERYGIPVFNSAKSIELCDNKAKTYIELEGIVPQPKTLIAPKCYFESDMHEFVEKAVDILGLPIIFKECFGSFGEQVYLCRCYEDILSHISEKPFILQKFISESSGTDTRIEIVNGECVCAVKRINSSDFRSNVTNGGTMTPCIPGNTDIENAAAACRELGLMFGGVDVLNNGMICEVNSNAHIINIMKSTGTDIAPLIFTAITEKLK